MEHNPAMRHLPDGFHSKEKPSANVLNEVRISEDDALSQYARIRESKATDIDGKKIH